MNRFRPALMVFAVLLASLACSMVWQGHKARRGPRSERRGGVAAGTGAPRVLAPVGAVIEDYVGPKQCVACHASICDKQAKSHMANALHTVEDYQERKGSLPTGQVADEVNHIQYDILADGRRLNMRATTGADAHEAPMHFVLGSGLNGLSFVRETDSEFQELRVAYYPKRQAWDFSPGHRATLPRNADERLGIRRPKESPAACLNCHATLLVQQHGRVDLNLSILGVTCERCHGPGRRHVEAARRGEHVATFHPEVEDWLDQTRETFDNPRALAAAVEMRLCGQCHGGDRFDADDLLLAEYTATALQQSRCYTESAAKLRCTDCHDPHSNADRGDHSKYLETCKKCHGTPDDSLCSVNPRGDCIACHMPRRQPIDRGFFTHHRIGFHPAVDVDVFGKQTPR